jgi:PAS domain S-box-containing protein
MDTAERLAALQAENERLRGALADASGDGEGRSFHAIADSIDQMIWTTRPDGFHEWYNRRWYEYTGMPEGSTDGEAWNGMFHPEDQDRAWAVWRHSLETGEPYHIEYRLRHRSGEYRWVLGRARPVRNGAGAILRWYGTCTDIHDSKMAEAALRESQARLATLTNNIPGVMIYQVVTSRDMSERRYVYVSDNAERVVGVTAAAAMADPAALMGRINPEEIERVLAAEKVAAERIETLDIEIGGRTARGDIRTRIISQPRELGDGRLVWDGIVVDITERRRQQQEAQRTAALLQAIGEATPDLIYAKDCEFRLTYANPATCRTIGIPPEHVVGVGNHELARDAEEAAAFDANDRAVIEGGATKVVDEVFTGPDGKRRTFRSAKTPIRDAAGQVIGLAGVGTDITERVEAEELLRQSEARLRAIFEATPECIKIVAPDGSLMRMNHAGLCMIEAPGAEAVEGACVYDLISEEYRDEWRERHARIVAGESMAWEFDIVGLEGTRRHMETHAVPLPLPDGTNAQLAVTRDITARKGTENALRESEEQLRLVVNGATDYAILTTDTERRITSWSDGAARTFGYPGDQAIGMSADLLFTPEDRDAGAPESEADTARSEGVAEDRRWHLRADGGLVFMNGSVHPLPPDADGRARGFLKIARDETQQRAAEQVLADTSRRLDAIINNTKMAVFMMDDRQQCVFMNKAAEELTGYRFEETQGRPLHDVIHHKYPDGRHYPLEECPIDRAFPEDDQVEGEELFVHKQGHFYPVAFTASPIRNAAGQAIGTVIEARNIAQEQARDAALRETEERYRLAARATNDAIWDWDLRQDQVLWNEALYEVFGYRPEEVSSSGSWWIEHIHPDDRERIDRAIHAVIDGDTSNWSGEYRFERVDGSYVSIFDRGTVIRDGNGQAVRMIGAMLDQTERLRAEMALRELNERLEQRVSEEISRRNEAEEALRQSQKMETLGQLTGGVAHDFNNLLQIVTGNLEILQRNLPADQARLRRSAENAMRGAERAAVLTQRLLAFARRQPLEPRPLSVNKLVGGMSELLHRTLGEPVELETVLAPNIWAVEADPNQLENAIINLAVNARDAMPDGGKLTIETSNTHLDDAYAAQNTGVLPGQYVVICISDTGTGMDEETLQRVFEPFFTTKDVGRGTGLGLSMVYGFVKQSGGHVKIYSEPGQGTTVKIYLPRLIASVNEEADEAEPLVPEGSLEETVLVCEDDDDVRAYSAEVLRELGYRVLEAHDGPSALRLLERQEGRVDLLFTDVVLPSGMMGNHLAEQARAIRPGLKVLFTTGYARNAIVHHGRLDPGVELITKPFTYADLAARIRDLLDRAPT